MCHLLSTLRKGRQNIFSTPRLNSSNGKFSTWSLYECISRQRFSVLLVSQASSLMIGQLDSSSQWNKTSYSKDCGHIYSVISSSITCKSSVNWNAAFLASSLIFSVGLWTLRMPSSEISRYSLLVPSSSAWAAGWSNFIWNPLTYMESLGSYILRVLAIPQSDLFSPYLFPNVKLLASLLIITQHSPEDQPKCCQINSAKNNHKIAQQCYIYH